jgi:hypothetical protein
MNLFTSLATVGQRIRDAGKKVGAVAEKAAAVARRAGFGGEVARVEDAVRHVKTAVSEASNMARDAAADALAKGGAGAGAALGARVGSQSNVYRRALSLFDSPAKRNAWAIGAGTVVVVALVLFFTRSARRR